MRLATRFMLGFLLVGSFAVAVTAMFWNRPPAAVAVNPSGPRALPPARRVITEDLPIKRGDTLADLLSRAGVDGNARTEMIAAVGTAFDVRKFRAGSQLTLSRSVDGIFESLEYSIDSDRKLQLSHSDGAFQAAVVDIPGVIRPVPVCGTLQGSLFESMESAGAPPELALQVAEIFAWDLDFYADPREGDQFCLLVEKKEYANGQPPTYRRILAATYDNAGTVFDGYVFPDENGKPQYYSRDGQSLQAAFLRSPLKFEARVSSRFSNRRFHPVLKIYRPHLGTDYAASVGTPVQAIAAGRVVFSGRSGGAGNMVAIRHANAYETRYLHLSRRFVRTGERVEQGQRIGAVGATGLATGPHLDFRVSRNGRFVNFERLRPPRTSKITAAQMPAFTAERDRLSALLDSGSGAPGLASLAE